MHKKHLWRTLLTLCVLVCSFGFWSIAVYGAQEPVTVTMDYIYEEKPVEDVLVEMYLVANWIDGDFTLATQFQDLDISFADLTTPSSWRDEGEKIEQFVLANQCVTSMSQKTDGYGRVIFTVAEHGVYYVDVADALFEKGKLVSSPVLVTLPNYDNKTDKFIYQVEMAPKVSFEEIPEEPDKPVKPDEPDDPDTPRPPVTPPEDPLIDLPDGEVPHGTQVPDEDVPHGTRLPEAGTWVWLIIPLAIGGLILVIVSVFTPRKKKNRT